VFQFGSLDNFVLEKFGMLFSLAQKERKKEKKGNNSSKIWGHVGFV
jgi:hypothetical protein